MCNKGSFKSKFSQNCPFWTPVFWMFFLRPKRKILLFQEMWVTRKIFTQEAANLFFSISLIEFFKESLHLESYSNSTFQSWKNKESCILLFKEKKRQLIRINLLVEDRLNGKFYLPNVFHSGFKIQSLTRTLHGRSQNLQPANAS